MSSFYCSLAWLHGPILLPTVENNNNNNNSSNNNNNGNKNNTSKTTKSSDKYTKIDEVEAGNREKVVPSEPGDVGRIQEKDLREIQGPNNREEEARGVDAAAECYVADFEGSPEADKLKEALFYVSQCYT
jgi:hypothetical protein